MNRVSGIFLIIIIIIVYPVNGFIGDYRYDTCQDYDTSNVNYIDVLAFEGNYYVCKIGFVEGKVTIGWYIDGSGVGEDVNYTSVSILNNENLNNFISGNSYGFSNSDIASLNRVFTPNELRGTYEPNIVETELIGDNYYLVINLGYRNSFGNVEEEINQKPRFERLENFWGSKYLPDFDQRIECSIILDYTK
tara:strand:- start:690 stop:1265 length:576 start_codon:yes stop_codon:yes gene_type:complete